MTLYLAIVRNKLGFDISDDVQKFTDRVKREYGCDVQIDYVDSSLDLEWQPYNVGGFWGPKDLKSKLEPLFPPKNLYHIVYFVYDATHYPEPGPLANWTYPTDFNGAALCFNCVKAAWLADDNLAKGLWHEGAKHGFSRLLNWKGTPIVDTTDNWGSEEKSDAMMVPLLKTFKDTILQPPAARVVLPIDDPKENKRLKGVVAFLKSFITALQNPKPTQLRPKVARLRDQFLIQMVLRGHPMKVTDEYRSKEAQDVLYAVGRTTKLTSPRLTNAKGGESFHNYGVAFDCCFLTDASITYEGPWEIYAEEGKKLGLEWGGDFPVVDKPHMQLTLGYSIEDFQKGRIDPVKYW